MHNAQITKRIVVERDEEAQEREGHDKRNRGSATTVLLRVPGSCRLRCTIARICSILRLPSAAGWVSTAGTMPDTNPRSNRPVEDPEPLPSLEELFSDFQSEGYVERLEELAASLMREVTTGMEANPLRTDEQVSFENYIYLHRICIYSHLIHVYIFYHFFKLFFYHYLHLKLIISKWRLSFIYF